MLYFLPRSVTLATSWPGGKSLATSGTVWGQVYRLVESPWPQIIAFLNASAIREFLGSH